MDNDVGYLVEGYCKSSNVTKIYFKTNNHQLAEIIVDVLSELCDNGDLLNEGEVVDSVYIVNN